MKRKPSQADIVRELQRKGLVPIAGGGPCTPLGSSTPVLQLCNPAVGEIGWDVAWYGNNSILDGLFLPGQMLRPANGGTGVNAGSAAAGALLIGTGSGLTLANLTPGSGISITDGPGSITIAQSGAPGGGSLNAAGVLKGSASGSDYSTTSASFVDVDGVNLKVTLTVPGAAKFILVWATFSLGASVITDGVFHARILAAGLTGNSQGCFVNNGVINPIGSYTLYGVFPNPPAGSQTIALQYKGDGVNAFVIKNPAAEGTVSSTPTVIPRVMYAVTN